MGTALAYSNTNGNRDLRSPTMNLSSPFALGVIGLFALIVISYATDPFTPEPRYTDTDVPAIIHQDEIRDDSLDQYLSRLAWIYECTGACAVAERNDAPFKIVDSNGLYSYGCLQFQEATYLAKAKEHGVDPWEGDGIYDCDNQWKIAKAMFQEDPEAAANHWYTSVYVRGLGLPNL